MRDRVTIRGHPVRADEHGVDLACRDAARRGGVRDDRVRDARLRSSQAAIRAPSKPGRVSATSTWTGRPAWCAAMITDSAVPTWPPAIAPVLPSVSTRSGGRSGRPRRTSREAGRHRQPDQCRERRSPRTRSPPPRRAARRSASPVASIPSAPRARASGPRSRGPRPTGASVLSALAAPRMVARRAKGRCSFTRAAVRASVTAASCAWIAPPTIDPSRIADRRRRHRRP